MEDEKEFIRQKQWQRTPQQQQDQNDNDQEDEKRIKKSKEYQKLKVDSHVGDGELHIALARITPL